MTNSSSRISMSVAFGHCTSYCIPSKGMVCFVQYVLFTCLKGVSHRGLEDGGSLRFSRVLSLGHSYNCATKPINKRLTPLHTCNLTQVRVCVCAHTHMYRQQYLVGVLVPQVLLLASLWDETS